MRFSKGTSLMMLSALHVACAEKGERTNQALVEVSDSAGVELIHNLDRSVDATAVQPNEQLRIGVADGAEEYQFHTIVGIATDQQSRLFVIDQGSQSIRIYDANGGFVRRIGGPGRGPGEFQQIGVLFLWRDTVFVADLLFNTNSTMFDTTGLHLSTQTAMLPDGRRVIPAAGGQTGWYFVEGAPFSSQSQQRAGNVSQDTVVLKRADPKIYLKPGLTNAQADSALKPVATYKSGRMMWYLGPERGGERSVVGSSPMFEPSGFMAIDGRGLVHLTYGWPYAIDTYDDTGHLMRRITRAHDTIPATDALSQEVLRRAKEFFDTMPDRVTPCRGE